MFEAKPEIGEAKISENRNIMIRNTSKNLDIWFFFI